MALFNFFKNKKDIEQQTSDDKLKLEREAKKNQQIDHLAALINDTSANGAYIIQLADEQNIDLNSDFEPGFNPPLIYALKIAVGSLEERFDKSEILLQNTTHFNDAMSDIEEKQKHIKNPEHHFAATLFSSKDFLELLGIPLAERPKKLVSKSMLLDLAPEKKAWNYEPKELTTKLQKSQFLYRHQQQKNAVSDEAQTKYEQLQKTYQAFMHPNSIIGFARKTITRIDQCNIDANIMPDAKGFIALVQDPDIIKVFPWVKNYKPNEDEFKNCFDGIEISLAERFMANLKSSQEEYPVPNENDNNGIEIEAAYRLKESGYYDWQKDRLTKDKEELLEKRTFRHQKWQTKMELEYQERMRRFNENEDDNLDLDIGIGKNRNRYRGPEMDMDM